MDAVRGTLAFESPEGKSYRARRAAGAAGRPAARLAPGRVARPGRRRADLRLAVRRRAVPVPQRRRAGARAGRRRTSTCPSSSRTTRRASGTRSSSTAQAALGVPRGSIRATVLIETIQRRVRDGRDPVRAARARGGPQRRPLGLPVQRDQDVPRRRRRSRSPDRVAADDDGAVHARLHGAARADLPSARRARDRRDGRVHPEPARPRGHRDGAGQGPRRQGAREPATASTGRGSRTPTWCPSRRRSSTRCSATAPNQKDGRRDGGRGHAAASCSTCASRAAASPRPAIRANIRVALAYLDSWLRGDGAAAIDNLMEDAATAEIARSQLWLWRVRAAMPDRPERYAEHPRRGAGAARRRRARAG